MSTPIPRTVHNAFDEAVQGQAYFLIEVVDLNSGETSWRLQDEPQKANLSKQPMLHGFCGATNNKHETARGMVRVVEVADEKARIVALEVAELAAVLAQLGHEVLLES